ncbi:ATP-dependent DNA helicase RecG [Patescibacteria group bacterium]|nr:ATP-dependent DNA helicase RecG [Patescibacteria group bacterium]
MLNSYLSDTIKTTPAYINKLRKLGIKTVKDFLFYFPRGYQDLSGLTTVAEIRTDEVNTLKGNIHSIVNIRTRTGKTLTKAIFGDETGRIEVVWFNQKYLKNMIRAGDSVLLSGKAKFAFGKMALMSPTYEPLKLDQLHTGRIVPVYHESEIITSKWIRSKIHPLIENSEKITDTLSSELKEKYQLIDLKDAIKIIHFPKNQPDLEAARKRLGFEEIFELQITALKNKWEWRRAAEKKGLTIRIEKDCLKEILDILPFKLTDAQQQSVVDILNDLKKPYPMMRLLEGDVGSGKTIVAALAAFNVIKNGYQVAIMAPTEVLAKQHFKSLMTLFAKFNIRVDFLAGSLTASEKKRIIMGLKTHTIDLIVGTHAIIQDKVDFANLALAIVDEQHRFGVKQRDILAGYGTPHLLSMTATPIPRTLAMTVYGDQDLTIIDELPPGRKEIITRIVPEIKRIDAYRWVENNILKGNQAYIICPLVEDSDAIEAKSATQEYERLRLVFPNLNLGLLHGRMKQSGKDDIMSKFVKNELHILISTTVIEVGIDVPNANIIMIEGAERFGLAQLHQLRGRVGRGKEQSYCFLFQSTAESRTDKSSSDQFSKNLTVTASGQISLAAVAAPASSPQKTNQQITDRLKAMVNHTSGFKLAEIDLELRGPGEVYGVRQSGIPDLKMASLSDIELIKLAREAAEFSLSSSIKPF